MENIKSGLRNNKKCITEYKKNNTIKHQGVWYKWKRN